MSWNIEHFRKPKHLTAYIYGAFVALVLLAMTIGWYRLTHGGGYQ